MKTAVKSILIALCAAILVCGCVPPPRQGDGRIGISVSWEKAEGSFSRSPDEIRAVTATLSRQSLKVVVPLTMDPAGGGASGTATGLYAGEWTVKVDAAMADGTVIYTGQTKVMVGAGETRDVSMVLTPAPGKLAISVDVQPLLDAGLVFDRGSLYVYHGGTTVTTKTMVLDGAGLAVMVELAPLTYDAKVAVPNVTDAVFTSGILSFDIISGRTTIVTMVADSALSVNISIATEPDRVMGLIVTPNGATASLAWDQVARATGYCVYRTDEEGRFKELQTIAGGDATTHIDATFNKAKPCDGKVRYAVAALAGTIEGLRSEPVEVSVGS